MVSTPLVAAVGGGSLSRVSLSVGGMTVLEKLLPGVAVYSVQAELVRGGWIPASQGWFPPVDVAAASTKSHVR